METAHPLPASAEQAIDDSLRFESLVAVICSELVHAGPENIDALIADALQRIAATLGGNRVLLGQFVERLGELVTRAEYRTSAPPFPERMSIHDLDPALLSTLMAGEVSQVADFSALPDSPSLDRAYFKQIGLRSYIAVPVLIDGTFRFILAVGNIGEPRVWPKEAVPRLRVLAEVLAIALLRCEAEHIVRSNEKLFRAFVEDAPVPIMLAPGPDKTPLYFNPAFTRLFGYTRQDIPTPSAWWPLAYPDPQYRAQRIAGWDRVVAAGLESGQLQDAPEAEIRRKNGEISYIDLRLALVDGYKIVFFNDLTARREMEKTLRLTQYAVDQNPAMIFRVDLAGRFVYANQAALRKFGWSRAQLPGKSIWDASAVQTPEQWPQRARELSERGGSTLETVYRHGDGSTFPVEVCIHAMRFSGEESFFCFALDISIRRAAQAESFAHLKRVQALAAELSASEEQQRREVAQLLHDEIGQDLFALTAQLVALKNRAGPHAESIGKALDLLDEITRHTRELTFQLCPPELSQLGLATAIKRMSELFAQRHGIAVQFDGSGQGPDDLNVRGLVYHGVRELLFNVAKHAHATRVVIRYAQEQGKLHMEVADDGGEYNAQPAARKPGFGLSFLRERIELLGGSLRMDCSQAGCRVFFELPLESPAAE